jgi:hypothetical protein
LIAAAQIGGFDHVANADHHVGDLVGGGHGFSPLSVYSVDLL